MEQGREEELDVAEGGLDWWWFRRGTPRVHTTEPLSSKLIGQILRSVTIHRLPSYFRPIPSNLPQEEGLTDCRELSPPCETQVVCVISRVTLFFTNRRTRHPPFIQPEQLRGK